MLGSPIRSTKKNVFFKMPGHDLPKSMRKEKRKKKRRTKGTLFVFSQFFLTKKKTVKKCYDIVRIVKNGT